MKRMYFAPLIVLAIIIGVQFANAQTKPVGLNCNLSKNYENEWCVEENGVKNVDSALEIDESEEDIAMACDPYFTVVPKYKAKKSDDTKKLQTILAIYTPNLKIDGSFGPKTKAALVTFQKENDIKATGVVDTATLDVLMTNYCEENTEDQG